MDHTELFVLIMFLIVLPLCLIFFRSARIPDEPIILCTGFSESVDSNKAALLGVKFLMKPVTKMALSNAVREVLAR